MTPTARNAAIAAAATLIPAAIAAAIYPDRARALPGRIADTARDVLDGDDTDTQIRRTLARLQALTDNLDLHTRQSTPGISPGALIAAGVAAALVIPAALAAIFAPGRIRAARDRAAGTFRDDAGSDLDDEVDEELSRVSERLETLTADLDRQRDDAFDSVTAAAQTDD